MKSDKQNGNGPLTAILVLVIVGIVGFVGWYVWDAKNNTDKTYKSAEKSSSQTPVASHGNAVTDYVSLIDALRKEGATVTPKGDTSQPFMTGKGYIISVNSKDVQVFEYKDEATAKTDADKVSADGETVGTTQITWTDKPHFFKKGKIIVIFVGTDTKTLELLKKTMGVQFAGAS